MLGAIAYNNLAHHMLANMGNINLVPRALARMDSIPEDRQADYTFRDIYLGLIGTVASLWVFRMMETLYMVPKMVQNLGLHNLADEYAGVPGAKDYKVLPRILEKRMLGYLVNEKSFYAVADLLRNYDMRKMQPGSRQHQEALVLSEQLQRRLDQSGYLKAFYGFNEEQASAFSKVVGALKSEQLKHFSVTENGVTAAPTDASRQALDDAIHQSGASLDKAFGSSWRQKSFAHLERKTQKTAIELLHDAATSQNVQTLVRQARKSGMWANIIVGVALSFVYQGLFGSWFDFNVLQPWQKKLVEARGTSREVVAPQVWSFIPAGLATLGTHLLSRKLPGYATRFILPAGVGFIVYTGSVLNMIKYRLSRPPQGKAARLAQQSKESHAPHHELEQKGLDKTQKAKAQKDKPKKEADPNNPFINLLPKPVSYRNVPLQ